MADTTFVDGTTIEADWMNDVNDYIYLAYNGGLPDDALTYYVATTGSDTTGTGESATPFATVQKAIDTISNSPVVAGSWGISVAAGTYSSSSNRVTVIGSRNMSSTTPNDTAYQHSGILSKNYIYIYGPDVGYDPVSAPSPVPTAIFDGGGAAAVGFQVEGPGVKVLFKNIKGINYDGSSSSGFIVGENAHIRCENVHGDGNNIDISSATGKLEVKGGILANASLYSIRSIFLNKHEIGNQNASAIGQGPFINGAAIGLLAQESSTGHADYVSFADCTDAIRVTSTGRVNFTGSDFKRCTRAARADANGVVFYSAATFNDGTVDACTENIVIQQGGVDVNYDTYSNNVRATDYLNAPVAHTGSTTSTVILSKTLDRGRFCPNILGTRKPQHIEFEAFGTITGTAAAKQFKLRLGATSIASITNTATDASSWECRGKVVFTDSAQQYGCITYLPNDTGSAPSKTNNGASAEDNAAADLLLAFEVQLTNAADTVTINHAHFKLVG